MPTIAIGSNINPLFLSVKYGQFIHYFSKLHTSLLCIHCIYSITKQEILTKEWFLMNCCTCVTECDRSSRQTVNSQRRPCGTGPRVPLPSAESSLFSSQWQFNDSIMASKQVSLVDIKLFGIKNLKILEIVSMYIVMLKIGNFTYKMTLTMKVSKISR